MQHCCQPEFFSWADTDAGAGLLQIDPAKNVRKLGEMHTYRCTRCSSLNRVPERRIADGPICGRCKQPLDASGAPQEVTESDLEQALNASPVPVLVDFW